MTDEMKSEVDTTHRENVGVLTLDKLLRSVGHCGRFQWIFGVLGICPNLPAAWGLMFMTFGKYNPGWSCQDGLGFPPVELNVSLLSMTEKGEFRRHQGNDSICDTMRTCQNLTFSDEASTIVTEWALICNDSWVASIIISVQMVGVTLGAITGGQVSDKLGRKLSIHGSVALLAATNFIAIFSVSWQMYAGVMFFVGLFCGAILASANVYVCELIPNSWRPFLGAFPFWSLYACSFVLCAIALKDWRHIHVANTCVCGITFLPVFWLPESLRFLTVHGQLQRANKAVSTIARLNKKPVPDTSIMTVIAETERENLKTRRSYTYRDLFRRSTRRSFVVIGMTWFIFAIGYYMIGFGLSALSGNFFVNLILFAAASIPLRIIAMIIAVKVGRKVSTSLFIFLSTACSFAVVGIQLLAPEDRKVIPTLVMALGASVTMEAAWGVLVALNVELFPTPIRNVAFGYCSALGRFGAVIAPYLISKDIFPMFGPFLLLGFLQLICFVGHLSLRETRHRPLQDNVGKLAPTKKNKALDLYCEG